MKYMTKDWYNNMQKQYFAELEIDDNANIFSEKYFKNLYEQKRIEYYLNGPGIKPDEFERYFNFEVEYSKKCLSSSILSEVKDIRVLALGHVTKKVYDLIIKHQVELQKNIDGAYENYKKEIKNQFQETKPKFLEEDFHDSIIIICDENENDCVLQLDNTDTYTLITEIIFKNFKIIKQDYELKNNRWIYNEIYEINDGYEIHVLLHSENGLNDFIINCSDVELRRAKLNKKKKCIKKRKYKKWKSKN